MLFRYIYIYLILPFTTLIMLILSLKNKKIKAGLKMRWPVKGTPHFKLTGNSDNTIWFHCSSGEFEYALPVIKNLKENYPKYKILVTYFSPTYKKVIEKSDLVDFSCALPWEFPNTIKQFLNYHKPKILLISRTDLWPELLYQTNKKNIKSILFSTTIKPEKFSGLKKMVYKFILKNINTVFFVSKEDQDNFSHLGLKIDQEVLGDSRYDQVIERLKKKKLNPPSGFSKPLFTIGSCWPEDEAVLLPFIKDNKDNFTFIIAPHEVDDQHIDKIKNYLDSNELPYRFIKNLEIWDDSETLIIDKIGYLAEVYKWSQYAFIGGSFKSSVHSVMEPLAAGCICFVGPHYTNNREAMEFKEINVGKLNALNIITDKDSLESLAKKFPSPEELETINHKIKNTCLKKSGASSKIAKKAISLIK